MNIASWKYSIHRLCITCYCNIHLTDQEQWTWGAWYWEQISVLCRSSLRSSQLWSCNNSGVQVCECYPRMYTLVWVLPLPTPGGACLCQLCRKDILEGCSQGSDLPLCSQWLLLRGKRPPSLCTVFLTSITHTLKHKRTLLTSTGHLISGRKFMGHNESENLTDFSFSTLPS